MSTAGTAVTPPAATPPVAPPPTPPVTPPPAAASASPPTAGWTDGLTDDLKGYIQNKQFGNVGDLANAYQNLEKLRGVPEERLLKLPESMEAPEMTAVWERLGAPKEAKGYNLEVPKEGADPKRSEWAAGIFHELKVPKGMAEKIVQKVNERESTIIKAAKDQHDVVVAQADSNLKREWGMAYDQNKVIADAAAKNIGMSGDELKALGSALGPEKSMKFLHKLGLATGEHNFVTGQPGGSQTGAMTPEAAQQQIKQLIGDATFRELLLKKDYDATQRWNRLHQFAAPENKGA